MDRFSPGQVMEDPEPGETNLSPVISLYTTTTNSSHAPPCHKPCNINVWGLGQILEHLVKYTSIPFLLLDFFPLLSLCSDMLFCSPLTAPPQCLLGAGVD